MKHPLTLKEAQSTRYTVWAGSPNGTPYRNGHCAYRVAGTGRAALSCQCSKKNGHGPEGLYCASHAKLVHDPAATTLTWYETTAHGWEVNEVKVLSFTDAYVVLQNGQYPRREKRHNQWYDYWPTQQEAGNHLKERAKHMINRLEKELATTRDVLNNLQKATHAH